MMKDIIIIGTGGTSREIVDAVEAINGVTPTWNILGFVDDNPTLHGQEVRQYRVLGAVEAVQRSEYSRTQLIIGIANDRNLLVRKMISERLGLPPHRYATLVHPKAAVSSDVTIGPGSIIFAGCSCSTGAQLGSHVVVLPNTVIAHDVRIGDFVSIAPAASIAGAVQIGEGAYIGMGAIIFPGVQIGAQSRVGIGSVVMRDVNDLDTVFGNPARVLSTSSTATGEQRRISPA